MTYSAAARTTPSRIRVRRNRVGLLIAIAAVAVAVGHESQRSTSPTAPAPSLSRDAHPPRAPRSQSRDALGEAGGAIPAGTTAFDEEVPGVANLDPALLRALRRAAADAGGTGVDLLVDSGWRSPAYQERLLQQAISKYGSESQAARWVATPRTSPHVSGDAADIGRSGAAWLSAHGATYGLCQVYRNEPWHYELRPNASERGCPAMYADPTQDPRMQQR